MEDIIVERKVNVKVVTIKLDKIHNSLLLLFVFKWLGKGERKKANLTVVKLLVTLFSFIEVKALWASYPK